MNGDLTMQKENSAGHVIPVPNPIDSDRISSASGPWTVTRIWVPMRWGWQTLTQRPILFLAASSFVLFGLLISISLSTTSVRNQFDPGDQMRIGTMIGVLLVQLAAIARFGMARNAVVGSVFFAIAISAAGWTVPLGSARPEPGPVLQSFTTFASLYSALGLVCALGAGSLMVRRVQAERRTANRQQLLERLFEVRQRLQTAVVTSDAPAGLVGHEWFRMARDHSHLTGWLLSGAIGLTSSLTLNAVDPRGVFLQEDSIDVKLAVAILFVQVSTWAGQVLIGFIAGRPVRAIWVGILGALASSAATFAISGPYGRDMWQATSVGETILLNTVMVLFAWLGGQGARLEENAAMQRRLNANNVEALNHEREELENLLRPAARRIGILAVDVKSSSKMKAAADPFDAEWSFREFQRFVSSVVNQHLGTIYSTAGDGAIAGFPTARSAVQAARALQADIGGFNQNRSRLLMPFRLRIGLNAGDVDDQLQRLEFTTVIDLAANAEALCPVGGIAASKAVVEETPDLHWQPLTESAEGAAIYEFVGERDGPA